MSVEGLAPSECTLCDARKSREHELLAWLVEVIHERDKAKAQLARLTQPPCCRPETAEPLGARIRRLREEQGVTLTAFAGAIGVTKGYLSEVERGGSVPGADVFARIADGLGVPMDVLYYGEAEDASAPDAGDPNDRPPPGGER